LSSLQIKTAAVFEPLLHPARYKGAHGGRGSGKSQFFEDLAVEDALRWPGDAGEGLRFAQIREVQKSLQYSSKALFEKKLHDYGLGEAQGFKVFKDKIELPGDGVMIFQGMQDHTADSIKSMEGFHRAKVEEAQTLSEKSMRLLRPTIRWEDATRGLASEIWFPWNPRHAKDPVDKFLRGPNPPKDSVVVEANWSDNPWFPKVLEQERQDALKNDPEQYGHIWEGEYAVVFKGAYYADALNLAEREGRIDVISTDPLLRKYAYWDIGGTSGKSDATAIWVVQFAGEQIRVIDHYEAVGQEFGEHVGWLHSNGHSKAVMMLPHDGRKHDMVHKVTPESFLKDAGFLVEVCRNIGSGAAMQRVAAVRRVFPRIVFDREKTKGGREALGWYHEKQDEKRDMGLGPEHDWSSHSADAFGQMAVDVIDRPKSNARKWSSPKRGIKGL